MNDHRGGGYSDVFVALVCHDATRGLARVQALMRAADDDALAGLMGDLHPDLRDAAIEGVRRARTYGSLLNPREHHAAWTEFLAERGWQQGDVRDPVRKTHPNLVDWEALPREQRDKDRVFLAIVIGMTLDVEAA